VGKFVVGTVVALLITAGIVFGLPSSSADNPVVPVENGDVNGSDIDEDTEEKLYDRTWVSPAMVEIGNYYPGGSAGWNLRVHNGSDTEAQFLVAYRVPDSDKIKEGYVMAPAEAGDWIIVSDPTPLLAPKETREIRITLVVPTSIRSEDLPVKWEFWTSVIEVTGDMIQVETCTRWLVSMRT